MAAEGRKLEKKFDNPRRIGITQESVTVFRFRFLKSLQSLHSSLLHFLTMCRGTVHGLSLLWPIMPALFVAANSFLALRFFPNG